ncbi:alpha/beta hydrolase family esterase, partial [Elusimicrobiota bacterium]
AQRLGCELSGKVSAIADVAGTMVYTRCRPKRAISVIMIHGEDDEHVPYTGGRGSRTHGEMSYRAVDKIFRFWGRRSKCGKKPSVAREGIVTKRSFSGCGDGAEVVLHAIAGEGHTWPGGRRGRRRADKPTDKVSAGELILDFFGRH